MKRIALLWLATPVSSSPRLRRPRNYSPAVSSAWLPVLSPEAKEHLELRTTLEFVRSEGLSKELRDATLDLAIATPDRLRIGTVVGKQRVEFGRVGQELWVSQPGKNFAVRGLAGVPRFAMDPASLDETELAPLGLRLDPDLLRRLPRLFRVVQTGVSEVDGLKCTLLTAEPLPRRSRCSVSQPSPSNSSSGLTSCLRASAGAVARRTC
jgi:hypothetical protein